MKIFFWGETGGNTGPDNVNRIIMENLSESFLFLKSRNRFLQIPEAVWKCLNADVTVISGVSRKGCLLAAFAKRTVYVLHGCAAREAAADGLDVKPAIRQERYLMRRADTLLCVSETFRDWFCGAYPQYARKTDFLHPCVRCAGVTERKIPGSVMAAGGDSALKNNAVLESAVEALEGAAKLEVCGGQRHSHPPLRHTRWVGTVPREEFLKKLARTEIFVLNSLFETFSLAVIEALCCGCSVLVSETAGVREVLALEETDILHDPGDREEIRRKLSFLQKNPNNARLLGALDREALSGQNYVRRLEEKCGELLQREKRR